MKMIASATVFRGKGECVAYMNGIVNEELRRQQEQIQAERKAIAAQISAIMGVNARRKARNRAEVTRRLSYIPTPAERFREAVATAWAWICAVIILGCESLKMWKRTEDDPW